MCDFSKGFKLCTCNDSKKIIHNKNSRRYKRQNSGKIEYSWILRHFVGKQDGLLMGHYMLPISNLGSGLSQDFVIQKLNSENCFDFDLSPQEGDNLVIFEKENPSKRIEFIYKNLEWTIDNYSPFDDILKNYMQGVLSKNPDL